MSNSINFQNRPAVFAELERTDFDLLVIGAGITGCGVARDAAMRGLRVALVDANDIASGTSSRSSKLVHGGIRYLAQGQVGLVREAATERKTLRRIAPHLAQRTDLIVPLKSRRSLVKFKAGLVAYERLGQVEPAEKHVVWSREDIEASEPHIIADNLYGAIVYPEYTTDDARLTLANARSAAAHGAVVATYAPVEQILVENGVAAGAVVGDSAPGGSLGARIRARVIVNAAGPFLDAVRRLEDAAMVSRLQLTKGVHVTLARERLPISHTVIMTLRDKRSVFVVPRGEFVYFGTTDTFYPNAEYWPEITADDVVYLLNAGNRTFDCGPFEDADIVSMWSGVRPLVAQEGKNPSEISRKDEILEGPAGVMSIAGGKLTSYRVMAQRIVDACQERLGQPVTQAPTNAEALPGGDFEKIEDMQRVVQMCGHSPAEAERLARLYGSEAPEIGRAGAGIEAEARWAVQREGAVTLEDYWVRRSIRARFDEDGGTASLEPASHAMAELLGWSETRRAEQVEACLKIRAREMACVRQEVEK